jgi:hypothetical protein
VQGAIDAGDDRFRFVELVPDAVPARKHAERDIT